MTFTVESKSQLAKLLATENIRIEHQKIATASFDPKNRVLYCPIWENMSGDLYDLLMGHEVGHALYTPPEGWHNAVSGRGRNFKHFLNVVEDVRIEKKIKRRFPGLNSSFIRGYNDLMNRDFFGTSKLVVNDLSFIDRMNIFFKSSSNNDIYFSNEERGLVDEVASVETWEDVLRITEVIFDYSKDEQYQRQLSQDGTGEYSAMDGYEDGDIGDELNDLFEQLDGEGEEESSEFGDEEGDDEGEESENDKLLNREKHSQPTPEGFEPTSLTEETFRKRESDLVSAECKPYLYLTVPDPILENIITPVKRVHELLEEYWFSEYSDPTGAVKAYAQNNLNTFRSRNERYVGLLAKEFEMKKAAKSYSKTKVSQTGDIDINKLYKYRVDDSIFRRMVSVPKGKSHGLVLLLDRSGSMNKNMAGSIEQIIVLSLFCRKVNIPFVVYGFGNNLNGRYIDFPTGTNSKFSSAPTFENNQGSIAMSCVFLREYINSKMGNAEFNRCLRNLVFLKSTYEGVRVDGYRIGVPRSEGLSNTPLSEAMVAMVPLTQEFRKTNNLDHVNLIVVHDGDADGNLYYNTKYTMNGEQRSTHSRFNVTKENVFVKVKNKNVPMKGECEYAAGRKFFFDYYREMTGAKIFGFFIVEPSIVKLRNSISTRYHDKDGLTPRAIIAKQHNTREDRIYGNNIARSVLVSNLISEIRKNKFLASNTPGYDTFFIIPGGDDLSINDDELEVNGDVTVSKLKTAFIKMNKKRQVNRVLVTRFIEGIAA